MTPRRELWLAVTLCLAGSALAIWAVGRDWVELSNDAGLTIGSKSVGEPGTRNASYVTSLGYLGVAGVLAIAATRGLGRVLVGAVIAAAGAALVVAIGGFLRDFTGNAARCPDDCTAYEVVAAHPLWGWLTVLGGVLMLLGGLVVAVRGRRWAALGSTYETPAARTVQAPVTDKAVWDALDEGHDPTA